MNALAFKYCERMLTKLLARDELKRRRHELSGLKGNGLLGGRYYFNYHAGPEGLIRLGGLWSGGMSPIAASPQASQPAKSASMVTQRTRWCAACGLFYLCDDHDNFLVNQLKPEALQAVAKETGHLLILSLQPGYNHNYHFITNFFDDHLRHHAAALKGLVRLELYPDFFRAFAFRCIGLASSLDAPTSPPSSDVALWISNNSDFSLPWTRPATSAGPRNAAT